MPCIEGGLSLYPAKSFVLNMYEFAANKKYPQNQCK